MAIGAVLAFILSVALTFAHWGEVGSPFAAVLAIVLVGDGGVHRGMVGRAGPGAVHRRAAVAHR